MHRLQKQCETTFFCKSGNAAGGGQQMQLPCDQNDYGINFCYQYPNNFSCQADMEGLDKMIQQVKFRCTGHNKFRIKIYLVHKT